jgi:quinol monooxygenase YgiN
MLAVHVQIQVKSDCVEQFVEATKDNATHSLQEEGVVRFDFVQNREDSSRFVLVEVYRDDEAPLLHKQTAHYARWRDTVESMMAVPRSSVKYETLCPAPERWSCS